ncbi:hypothetical protein GX48_04262 [Paracoccidioides brasiliensis]|nr:hypothetical protein GX48_04262 [Paracoccidioides brasiliensis]
MNAFLPFAHVVNPTFKWVVITCWSCIGTLHEYDASDAYLVDPSAEPLALTSLPVETLPLSPSGPMPPNSNPMGSETQLSNGITIYGNHDTVTKITGLCNMFLLWDDYDNTVDLPQDQWMQILLIPGRKPQTSAKVYLLGQKDREVVDDVFDKLHQQGCMD